MAVHWLVAASDRGPKRHYLPLALCLVCLLPAKIVARNARINNFAGPFRIELKYVQRCPPELNGSNRIVFTPYIKAATRAGQPSYYSGNISFEDPLDSKTSMDIEVSKWSSGGGWVPNAFRMHFDDFCRSFETMLPTIFKGLLEQTKAGESCPIDPGFYTVKNLAVKIDGVEKIPVLPYGHWKLTGVMKRQGAGVIGCVMLIFDTVPK